uniref:Peptidase M12B domain-containing protein n=1 Tax=Paramormyrops kingsleyae TaxID=1676925 RepID=A0A3B3RD72_9TELE
MILPGCRRWLRNLIALNCSLYVCVFSFLVFKCTASRKDAYSDDRWLGKQHSIDQYGIIHPMWSYPARHRRSPGNPADQAWDAEVIITAEGRQLMLQLQRNKQLFSPRYKETWYSPDGARRTFSPHQESCFFHGVVAGEDDSSVAVSGCGGLRGLITVNSSMTYLIEPLAGRGGLGTSGHAVYRAEHLRLPKGTCGHRHNHAAQVLEDLIHGMAQAPPSGREKRDMSGSMKYVELLLVADHAEFQKHGRDYQRTRMKLLEAANHVDKFYKGLDIRVALIGLEIWTDEDKISVSANPYSTLGSFLAWRRKQLRLSPNDNAQLITGISFQGTTIGLAPLNAMCSEYQSGGVNSVRRTGVMYVYLNPSRTCLRGLVSLRAMSVSLWAVSVSLRAMSVSLRAMSVSLRAVSVSLRAVSVSLRAVSVSLRAMSVSLRAMSVSLRAVSVSLRAMSVSLRAMSVSLRAVSVSLRAVSVSLRAVSVSLRAMSVSLRAVSVSLRAVSVSLRAVSVSLRAVSVSLRAVSVSLRAMSVSLRAVSVSLRAVSVSLRAVSVSLRAPPTQC